MPFQPQPRSAQTHGPTSPPTGGAARIGHEDWHPNVIKFNGKVINLSAGPASSLTPRCGT